MACRLRKKRYSDLQTCTRLHIVCAIDLCLIYQSSFWEIIEWGWYDTLEKLAGVHCSRTNACRNLHKLLDNRTGLQVPIPLEVVQITIRRVRPLRCVEAWWPQLTMRSWLRFSKARPSFGPLRSILHPWRWRQDIIKESVYGSGLAACGEPFGTQSLQRQHVTCPLLYITDSFFLDSWLEGFIRLLHLRHSMTTRFLYSCINASLYHKHITLDQLLAELARQACDLYENGFSVFWLQKWTDWDWRFTGSCSLKSIYVSILWFWELGLQLRYQDWWTHHSHGVLRNKGRLGLCPEGNRNARNT